VPFLTDFHKRKKAEEKFLREHQELLREQELLDLAQKGCPGNGF
jgi:hypothetical protein